MAPRSFWKGYLKLSLVTCPVAMVPATSDNEKVRFHTLNRSTGNRVVSQYVDGETGDVVEDDDQAKGYQRGEDDYLLLEEDEISAVALESTRTIDIDSFVPRDDIDWIWYDKPHYLVPDDPVGEEAFAVIRDAMASTGTVGISRLVLYRRERAVMLKPRDAGIELWTLHFGDEIREAGAYFEAIDAPKVDSKLMEMMQALIKARTVEWSPSLVSDPVQEKLLEIIAAKKKGKKPAIAKPTPKSEGNVVSIFDALKRSLSAESKPKKG